MAEIDRRGSERGAPRRSRTAVLSSLRPLYGSTLGGTTIAFVFVLFTKSPQNFKNFDFTTRADRTAQRGAADVPLAGGAPIRAALFVERIKLSTEEKSKRSFFAAGSGFYTTNGNL